MRRRSIARFCFIPLVIVSVSIITAAADPAHRFPLVTRTAVQTIPCKPPAVNVSRDASMFSETQEVDLGDAIAEQLVRDVQIIDDDAVAARLRAIGDRLVRNLPPSSLRFEFFLIEIADVTAFVLPGGRVFVSTKLVGFAQSEDELAGVMSHELGHLLARQQAIQLSRAFKRALDVDKVGDRADIFEKYHQFLDNAARDPYVLQQSNLHENDDQIAADRLGLFVLAAAGYDTQAPAKFYDRLAETKGRTGGFFSNLFGTTSLEVRRLRELIQATGTLPANCVSRHAATDAAEFQRWQAAVVGYTGLGRKESLTGVISRTKLDPPLRGQVQHLRFSPDGTHLLAQDDAGIAVLSRTPFTFLFRIDAARASNADFSPDSRRVVFLTADHRVESWRVADRVREHRLDPLLQRSCSQVELSSTGMTLACFEFSGLRLLDVATGAIVFERKDFSPSSILARLFRPASDDEGSGWRELTPMAFSADGRYFAAGSYQDSFVYDVTAGTVLQLKQDARRLIGGGFTFAGGDRIAAVNRADLTKSAVIALPAGEIVQQFTMAPNAELSSPANSPLMFVRPFQKYAVAVMDMTKSQIVKGTENPAIDIHGDAFVLERGSGELGLYDVETNKLQTTATLPASPIGRPRASAVSDDFRWLAFSERSRGGIYDLATGRQVTQLRGFRGAWMDESGALFADLVEDRQESRRIVRLEPATRAGRVVLELKPDEFVSQIGGFLVKWSYIVRDSVARGVSIEMRDTRTAETLWTKTVGMERFRILANPTGDTMALVWAAGSQHARDEAGKARPLRTQLNMLRETAGDYFVQVFDSRTGASRGSLFLETGQGSFQIRSFTTAGDLLLIEDSENRTRAYSLTGEQKGRVFGTRAISNTAAGHIAVENGAGKLLLYDLATFDRRRDLTFSYPVAAAAFSADGKRLFVLTSDQTAYVIAIGS